MTNKKRVVVSWSTGKDATLCLMRLLERPDFEVCGLFTTHVAGQIPFQSTSLETAQRQASRLGLPLITAELPEVFPDNSIYQDTVISALRSSKLAFDAIAFGDLYCNGIDTYRKNFIEPAGWECVFPLLGESPDSLATEIINRQIKAYVLTVDSRQLAPSYIGQEYSQAFIDSLPPTVDPCGENGEFHTLVIDTPAFNMPLEIQFGKVQNDGRFHHQEYQLLSADNMRSNR